MTSTTTQGMTMHKAMLRAAGFSLALFALLAVPVAHAQNAAATRFTPVADDDSVKNLADSLGNTPEERQQILLRGFSTGERRQITRTNVAPTPKSGSEFKIGNDLFQQR